MADVPLRKVLQTATKIATVLRAREQPRTAADWIAGADEVLRILVADGWTLEQIAEALAVVGAIVPLLQRP